MIKGEIMMEEKGQERPNYKLYVEVGAVYEPDGTMVPKYLRLTPDGEKFVIDHIYRAQRSASRRAGGCGICYSVRIRGKDALLYYEDSPHASRWFVESRYPVPEADF